MSAYGGGHITWGPEGQEDQQHFAIAGPDLKLFWDQLPDRGEANARGYAEPVENYTLVGVNQSIKNARCIAWTPTKQPARMLAAGLPNGRILLANFRGRWSMDDCETMELWNGNSKQTVNALQWNPVEPGRLAGGFNRIHRDSRSVVVWDVNRPDWQWLKESDEPDLFPSQIAASRSRGSMERLSALAAAGTIGFGSGERLVDVESGVTHSSSGLSAGSRVSDGDRSGSERLSGGRVSSDQIDALSGAAPAGGPFYALRRDISGSLTTSSQSSNSEHLATPFGDGATVLAGMGEQEQSQSVGWLPDAPTCLAVGTCLEWLRIYDIRTQKVVADVAAHTGMPVQGVRVAPSSPHHIATFENPNRGTGGGASVVKIWDSRRLQMPLLSWSVSAPLIDVEWVSTAEHTGNLATLVAGGRSSDAGAIMLWSTVGATDMVQRNARREGDDVNQRSVPPAPPMIPTPARTIRLIGEHPPTAFAWHPTLPQALVLAEDGQIAMMNLRPPTAVAWHGQSLAIGFGTKLQSAQVSISNSIETTMKRRVKAGYAMSASQNASITAPEASEDTVGERFVLDPHGVHFAWEWMEKMERLSEGNMLGKRPDGGKRGDKDDHPYHGVRQAIRNGATAAELGSETYTLAVNGLEGVVYGGHARQLTMRLCGWEGIAGQVSSGSCGQDAQAQEEQLLRLESEGHHTRAAALAIFALDIRRAVLALQRAVSMSAGSSAPHRLGSEVGQTNRWMRLAALALGGYSPGREKEWGQTCVDLGILSAVTTDQSPQNIHHIEEQEDAVQEPVSDPYLRAAFVFLGCHATFTTSTDGVSRTTGAAGQTDGSNTPSSAQSSNVTQESYSNQPVSPGGFSNDRSVYSGVAQSLIISADGDGSGGADESTFLYKRSHFAPVLDVDGLTRFDAIAFACRFLEDDALVSYLDSMELTAINSGSLEGLLLLGLTEKSIPLLQAFVNATADIQTAALLLAFVSPRRFKCGEASNWMTTYRDLLDRWQMYHERCQLDICIVPYSSVKVPPQTYATCQFCGDNLTHGARKNKGSGRGASRAMSGSRIRTCPSCAKPLPRCSVCLLTMDTANPAAIDTTRRTKLQLGPAKLGQQPPNVDAGAASFERWFTWCQCCHHGGHAECLRSWFELHTVCPVSGCKCICLSKDFS